MPMVAPPQAQAPRGQLTSPQGSQPLQPRQKRVLAICDPNTGRSIFDDAETPPAESSPAATPVRLRQLTKPLFRSRVLELCSRERYLDVFSVVLRINGEQINGVLQYFRYTLFRKFHTTQSWVNYF